jgi:hypothetical protein
MWRRGRGVNLDGGSAGGVDLDSGGSAAIRRMRRRSGRLGTGVEAVDAANAEEEWAPMGVWRGNDMVRV